MVVTHAPSISVSLSDSPAMSHAHAVTALRVFLQYPPACAEPCFIGVIASSELVLLAAKERTIQKIRMGVCGNSLDDFVQAFNTTHDNL
jgi:hypothetical protein